MDEYEEDCKNLVVKTKINQLALVFCALGDDRVEIAYLSLFIIGVRSNLRRGRPCLFMNGTTLTLFIVLMLFLSE